MMELLIGFPNMDKYQQTTENAQLWTWLNLFLAEVTSEISSTGMQVLIKQYKKANGTDFQFQTYYSLLYH